MENQKYKNSEQIKICIDEEIRSTMAKMLPSVSGEKYKRSYDKYQAWRQESNLLGPTNERELFAYLHNIMDTGNWKSPGMTW